MTTRLTIAGAVLVLAIVFGFIFWNQFSSSQKQLAGGTQAPVAQNTNSNSSNPASNTSSSKYTIPANDSVSHIESDLSGINITNVDSSSTQLNSQLNGF